LEANSQHSNSALADKIRVSLFPVNHF